MEIKTKIIKGIMNDEYRRTAKGIQHSNIIKSNQVVMHKLCTTLERIFVGLEHVHV